MRGFFAALRMTEFWWFGQRTDNDEYRDSGCARMTSLKTNAGILRCAQNDKQEQATTKCGGPSTALRSGRDDGESGGAALRMTSKNKQRRNAGVPPLRCAPVGMTESRGGLRQNDDAWGLRSWR